ncbi:unnamed protein product [Clonostachys rosea]|uniref:F-box domain-containing protein n=1 Tax=Bionectria ochroleuca TaxID=29856 RepID=A0ABY6TXJ9_BIOOC|nr:unnamed protein product [Clonostachys rosea]
MGGWDYYCALCGGPFGVVYWDSEDDDDYKYDPDVLRDPDDPQLAWLQDNRIIGENPSSDTPSKVWVSGPAVNDDYGTMNYELGETPDPALAALQNGGSISVYAWEADDPWCAPFHTRCREVLSRYVGVPELDKEIFFDTLKSKAADDQSGRSLNIHYGDISDKMEQYWGAERNAEHYVCDPVEVKGLRELYYNLPLRKGDSVSELKIYSTEGDTFARFPPDILLLIASHLKEVTALYTLRQASPAFANLELSNGFWRKRLKDDMPWLWDLPTPTFSQLHDVDWKKVYHRLDWGSRPYARKQNRIPGLCNRRRIWTQLCPVFAEEYTQFAANVKAWGSTKPLALKDAFESTPRQLGCPEVGGTRAITENMIDFFGDLPSADISLVVDWAASQHLIDIHLLKDGHHNPTKGQRLTPDHTETVHIPDDDWLTGLIFTSREEMVEGREEERYIFGLDILFAKRPPVKLGSDQGDKRLFYVSSPDRFIVALKPYRTDEGILTRMGLVEQPSEHAEGCHRIIDSWRDNYSISTMEYSWCRELPPLHVRLSQASVDRFSYLGFIDQNPMELLMFGTSEQELADITSISIDIHLGGVQVTYGHRPSRAVGFRFQAMKTLPIDGRGGERIVQCHSTVQGNPNSLTFLTNRGRCLSIGKSVGSRGPLRFTNGSTNLMPCGIYACWMKVGKAQWLLRSVGAVGSVLLGHVDITTLPSLPQDTSGYYWEPSMLPRGLEESGTIWGSRVIQESSSPIPRIVGTVPSMGCTVSRLDCSRPIAEMRVTLVHSTSHPILAPITAIAFKYTDGEEAAVGPDVFPSPSTCDWCSTGSSIREEIDQVPHYRHQIWKVGGRRLSSLRIWRPDSMSLGAIQFIAEGRKESPIWGFWGHNIRNMEAGEMRFVGEGGGDSIGLKLFFQGIGRGGFRDDTVIVAIQGLSMA